MKNSILWGFCLFLLRFSLTSDRALASIACSSCTHSIWRSRDLVASVFDDNGVPPHFVRHIGHLVRPVLVILNAELLQFSVLILKDQISTSAQIYLFSNCREKSSVRMTKRSGENSQRSRTTPRAKERRAPGVNRARHKFANKDTSAALARLQPL